MLSEHLEVYIMKNKIISFISVFVLIFSFSLSFVFADNDNTFNVSDPDTQQLIDDTLNYLDSVDSEDVYISNVDTSIMRVSPNDTNGLHKIILELIGDYNPVVTDYEYRNNNNTYYSHSIDISPDWSWIASAVIFALVIYCVFRLIGSLFSGRL